MVGEAAENRLKSVTQGRVFFVLFCFLFYFFLMVAFFCKSFSLNISLVFYLKKTYLRKKSKQDGILFNCQFLV